MEVYELSKILLAERTCQGFLYLFQGFSAMAKFKYSNILPPTGYFGEFSYCPKMSKTSEEDPKVTEGVPRIYQISIPDIIIRYFPIRKFPTFTLTMIFAEWREKHVES